MRLKAIAFLVCFLAAGAAQAVPVKLEATASPLEGSRWQVKVSPDEAATEKGEHPFDDTIVFQGGKVSMSECVKVGFEATPYSVTKSGTGWSFRTEQFAAKLGTTVWTAEIEGSTIRGKLVSTKNDGNILVYSFDGKKEAR